jgi:hypothetical protein
MQAWVGILLFIASVGLFGVYGYTMGRDVEKLQTIPARFAQAERACCKDRGCSLLWRFPNGESRWVWIDLTALPLAVKE